MADVDRSLAVNDQATGAYPRELLMMRAGAELARSVRDHASCTLFLVDVDHFKIINDLYGSSRGDELLRRLALSIEALSRPGDELFSYGGDEFVLLLPDTGHVDAVRLATTIVDRVRDQVFPGEPSLRISVSLGVATFPDDAADLPALLACARRRGARAKDRGRACAVADDIDTPTAQISPPLLERDRALVAVDDLLTRLDDGDVEALAVSGPRGSGHSRFLDEAGHVARLRGFHVVAVDTLTHGPRPIGDRVLVVADRGRTTAAVELVGRWRSAVRRIGLIFADSDETPGTHPLIRGAANVELAPWSIDALRVWLRSALGGEPTTPLVAQLHQRSGGLPARAQAELESMRTGGRLSQRPDGWWLGASPAPRRRSPWPALPVAMTALVGRTAEREHVVRLLSGARLVTLAGPGGIGKTRLSLAVATALADTLADGVLFVALGELDRGDLVVRAIVTAAGAEPANGGSPLDAVVDRLADRQMLLVLDNFEQVLDAGSSVSELLRRLPGLRVLVTSRERLSVAGERVYQVPPLPLPAVADLPNGPDAVERALARYPALALFNRRAMAAGRHFRLAAEHLAAVTEICRRLDGLPLAIELAAARIDLWSPQELLTRLGQHLDALREGPRDVPARQRTLRGAIDWSVDLLAPADRALFVRLAVFTGGCTVAAAAEVVDPQGVAVAVLAPRLIVLTEKNLLVAAVDDDGTTRFTMLETVRRYALELLAAEGKAEGPPAGVGPVAGTPEPTVDGAAQVWARHTAHFSDLAERVAELLMGPDRARCARTVEREYTNLRTAFETAMSSGDTVSAMRLCRGLWQYWCDGRRLAEGRDWCDRLLACPKPPDGADGAELLYITAVLAHHQDDHDAAQVLAERCLAQMQALGDRLGAGRAHSALGMAAFTRGEYELAIEHHAQSLADWRELGFTRGMAVGLGNLTKTALRLGDADRADGYLRERLGLSADDNPRDRLLGLEDQIDLALLRGDVAGAREFLVVSVPLARELKDAAGEALATHQLGLVTAREGTRTDALRLLSDALAHRFAMNLHEDVAISLECVAREVAVEPGAAPRGDSDPYWGDPAGARAGAEAGAGAARLAAELLGAATAVRQRHHLPSPPSMRPTRDEANRAARLALGDEEFDRATAAGHAASLEQTITRAREACR